MKRRIFGFQSENTFYLGDRIDMMDTEVQIENILAVNSPDVHGGNNLGPVMDILLVETETHSEYCHLLVPINDRMVIETVNEAEVGKHIADRAAFRERKLAEQKEQNAMMATLKQMMENRLAGEDEDQPTIEDEDQPGAETLEDAEAEALSEDAAADNVVDLPNAAEFPESEELNPEAPPADDADKEKPVEGE